MIGDIITPRERLRRLSPNVWQSKLALCFIAAACILGLMLEARASDMPPFKLSHPLCATGFTLAQRIDTRDRFGIIIKREWKMTNCANGRIVYGRKV